MTRLGVLADIHGNLPALEAVIDEFKTARIQITPFLNWRRACCPHAPIDWNLLEEFRKVDRFAYTPLAYRR